LIFEAFACVRFEVLEHQKKEQMMLLLLLLLPLLMFLLLLWGWPQVYQQL